MKLEHMTSPDVDALDRETIFVVTVESLEQHSDHLPVFTDSLCGAGKIGPNHTGETQISMILALRPDWVRPERLHIDGQTAIPQVPRITIRRRIEV